MLSAIPPQRVFDMFRNGEIRLIDIRESSEYAEKFIPGARLVPLSAIDGQDLKDASSPDKPVVFFCCSGKRTDKNAERLERLAGNVDAFQMEGGMTAWEKEGLPVKLGNAPFPLFRQIQIGAGVLVLSGILGAMSGIPCTGSRLLSVQVSFLPASPGSAGWAFCSHACRGTGADSAASPETL